MFQILRVVESSSKGNNILYMYILTVGCDFSSKYVDDLASNKNQLRIKQGMKAFYSHCKNIFLFSVSRRKIIYMPEAFSEESVREKKLN